LKNSCEFNALEGLGHHIVWDPASAVVEAGEMWGKCELGKSGLHFLGNCKAGS